MRDVPSHVLEINLSGGVGVEGEEEVRLAMVEVWEVPLRLMMTGKMSTVVPGQCCRIALARAVYLWRILCAMCERLWSLQYFHSPI
jgi:hypothetical protein